MHLDSCSFAAASASLAAAPTLAGRGRIREFRGLGLLGFKVFDFGLGVRVYSRNGAQDERAISKGV